MTAIMTTVLALGAQRSVVTVNDTKVFPESVTSDKAGAIIFGSVKNTIYRAAPGGTVASAWISGPEAGLLNVLGVFADDRANLLWVCSNGQAARGGAPAVGETALKAFDLRSGAPKASYPFPGGGLCNDIAVAKDGTVYATDTTGNRILRLKRKATALDEWSKDPLLVFVDGISILADGQVYANGVRDGQLVRVPVKADGSAGAVVKLDTSKALARPDGMRSVGPDTMLLVEGDGHLDEVKISGDRAEVKVLKDGFMNGPTAVTLVGDSAFVLEAKQNYQRDAKLRNLEPGVFTATAVPYLATK
jgi:sugar lactone lactonase YvrE